MQMRKRLTARKNRPSTAYIYKQKGANKQKHSTISPCYVETFTAMFKKSNCNLNI